MNQSFDEDPGLDLDMNLDMDLHKDTDPAIYLDGDSNIRIRLLASIWIQLRRF